MTKKNPWLTTPDADVPKNDPPKLAPKPEPSSAPSVVSDSSDTILGRPRTMFTPAEQDFILKESPRYLEILRRHPGARVFVDEVLLTAIQMQRLDSDISALPAGDANDTKRASLEKRRAAAFDQHCSALEQLGARPKDTVITDAAESLANLYVRYVEEVNARIKRGHAIGTLDSEALELAANKRMDVTSLRADVMSDESRGEVLEEIEKEQ